MNTTDCIESIMTPVVITAAPDETIQSVKYKLGKHSIHHIPVVMNGEVVGMISKNDIHQMEHHFTLFHVPKAEADNRQIFETMLAKEIMSVPPIRIRNNELISAAAAVFLNNVIHALPVVNEQDRLVGIITPLDLIRFAFKATSV